MFIFLSWLAWTAIVFPTRLHSLWSTWWTTTVTCEAASSFSGSETVKLQCKCFAWELFGLQLHHLQLLLITTDQRQIMTWFNLLEDKIQNYELWYQTLICFITGGEHGRKTESRAWKQKSNVKFCARQLAFNRLLRKLGVEHAWATALQERFYPENCGKTTAMSEFLEAERARASFVEGSVWLHNEYNSTVFPQSPCSPWCIAHGGYFGDRVTSWTLTSRNNEKRWDLGYSRTDIFPWWWPETHLAAREDWSLGRISGLMQARIILFFDHYWMITYNIYIIIYIK